DLLVELRGMLGGLGDENSMLRDLTQWPSLLGQSSSVEPPGALFSAWFKDVKTAGVGLEAPAEIAKRSGFADRPFWKPFDVYQLADSIWAAQQKSITEGLLVRMAEVAGETTTANSLPGLARL